MADFISTQDLINVKQDIKDIGLSVNTDGVITPRYGAAYDSLPKVIREMIEQKNLKLAELQLAIDTAVAAGVGAAGWYSYLVVHDNGETQKQIDDYIGATWYARVGGYQVNDKARLASGETVISTIPNNTNNPNLDMTGWVLDKSASQIIDSSGLNQQKINDGRKTLRMFGAVGDGVTDDTQAFIDAINSGIGKVYGVKGDVYLLNRTFNDGSLPNQQYASYCVSPSQDCTIDLQGATIKRGKIGDGDNISMFQVFYVVGNIGFTIKNGIVDMNNHNARFAVWQNDTKPDHGAEDLIFINTRNSGTSRTLISSADLITIKNTDTTWVRRITVFVGSNGDLTGDCAVDFNIPTFGVRISTTFVTIEGDQTESTNNCYAKDCNFIGPFLWQPIEIAGTGTKNCYAKDIFMYRPLLSMVDLDKGCKSCYFENITAVKPLSGYALSPAGGNGFIPVRFQGFTDGVNTVYTENCYAKNINLYQLPSAFGTATTGTLIGFFQAKNCKAQVTCWDQDKEVWELVASDGALTQGNIVHNTTAKVRRLNVRNTEQRFTVEDSNIAMERGLFVSDNTYLDDSTTDITLLRNKFSGYNGYTPAVITGFVLPSANQPKIKIIGNTGDGLSQLTNIATGATLNNVYILGNTSIEQRLKDVYPTEKPFTYNGNITKIAGKPSAYRANVDFAPVAAGSTVFFNITVTGVAIGDVVKVNFGRSTSGAIVWGDVTGTNNVRLYLYNPTAAPIDLPSTVVTLEIS